MIKLPRWEDWTEDFITRVGQHCIDTVLAIKPAPTWAEFKQAIKPLEDIYVWSTMIHLIGDVHTCSRVRDHARKIRAKISEETGAATHKLSQSRAELPDLDEEAAGIVARAPEIKKTPRGIELESQISALERKFLAECASPKDLEETISTMERSPDEKAREAAFNTYINRCAPNRDVLPQIAQLRLALAQEYGFSCFADFIYSQTPHRMIRRPADFLAEIKPALLTAAQAEAREIFNSDTIPYWNWKFSLKNRRGGNLETAFADYSREFGVKFTRLNASVWASEVECYELMLRDGRRGVVYFDLYPREGKFNHAATYLLSPPGETRASIQAVLCNLSREWSLENTVAVYHELGHVIHHAHMRVKYRESINVEMDFVEVPARLMERFIYPHPPDWAIGELRQLVLAEYDLELHGQNPPRDAEECAALMRRVFAATPLRGDVGNFFASFAHYVEMYPAYYYCYVTAAVWGDRLYKAISRGKKYSDLIPIFEMAATQPTLPALERFIN